MKRILCLAGMIAGFINSYAQDRNGRVIDAYTGHPLAGASILYAGKKGVASDKDGTFSVPCVKGEKITVSSIGYETTQHTIRAGIKWICSLPK